SYLELKNGGRIAYHKIAGKSPGVIFLGGFRSDMSGVKAMALENYCRKQGRAFIRFDYEGHGESSGKFEDGTIGKWTENALTILTELTKEPQILVGSSMGGWISLLLAKKRPNRIAAIVGIAAAPDFTERLIFDNLTKAQVKELDKKGKIMLASDYGEQYPITKDLIIDGRNHLLLNDKIPVNCPVTLLHGLKDIDVPWEISLETNKQLSSKDVKTILIENGDHRLSEPSDIKKIISVLGKMIELVSAKW
ncbi:MAG: alpha/beta hydrolase, partial [Pseudomonadota bacterium]